MCRTRSIALAISFASLAVCGCPQEVQTVPGPESEGLSKRMTGYILQDAPGRGILAVSLPDLKETVVRPLSAPNDAVDDPTIHALSGPDNEGRVAYIEDHFFVQNQANRRHLLKIINIDGTGDTALFSRPGDAMWAASPAGKGEIGAHLALAPTGGKVAFLSGLSNKQMPGALFNQGTIEIWDVNKRERLPLKISSINQPMSWFPDGTKLAIPRFIARKDVPNTGVSVDEFGSGHYTGAWGELPAIYILDIQSGETRFLSLGWTPVVSANGKGVFIGAWIPDSKLGIKFVWKHVDVATGLAIDVTWPGSTGDLIANPVDDLILYCGLPTTGAKSMLLTIKVSVLNSGRFQTVIPDMEPRHVSFGQVRKK
jgi:hypothetical protein